MADWFKIEAKAKGSKEASKIYIYDMIGEGFFEEGVSAKAFARELDRIDSDQIQVHINSPGGNYFDAMAIYNSLLRHPANVTSIVDGHAASAASVVALAGNEVIMAQGAQMMIHNASGIAMGNSADFRKVAEDLDKLNASMASVYQAKGGGKQDDWRALMDAETWMTAQEAVDHGLADRVEQVRVPAEVKPQASWDLSRFKFAGREKAPSPQAIAREPDQSQTSADQSADVEPPAAPAPGSLKTEGAGHMDSAKLREAFELAADASDEEVRAAVAAAGLSAAPPAPQASATQPDDVDQLRKDRDGKSVVTLEAGNYDALIQRVEGLEQFKAQAKARERDEVIEAAIADGRILPANKANWVANWDANPDGTKRLIDQLTPGLVPMAEQGYGADLEDEDLLNGMPHEFAGLWPRQHGKGA
jgi:ATP-dependent protease ClpP protease subunit